MDENRKSDNADTGTPQLKYEEPSIRELSEEEILKEFQVTRSMAVWWATGAC